VLGGGGWKRIWEGTSHLPAAEKNLTANLFYRSPREGSSSAIPVGLSFISLVGKRKEMLGGKAWHLARDVLGGGPFSVKKDSVSLGCGGGSLRLGGAIAYKVGAVRYH